MIVVVASAKREPKRPAIVVTLQGEQPTPDPARFDEAIAAWRAKTAMSGADWLALTEAQRQRAFKVAGVANMRLLSDAWNALDRAVEKGETFADFKAAIGAKLQREWGGERPGALETIFRTNVQTAYSHGRYAQQTTPSALRRRPFWKFSAIQDARTTPICQPLNGKVLAADDPFWSSHIPPLHFNCRSTVIALTAAQAEREGISTEAPDIEAAEGFGLAPDKGGTDFTPDLSNVPAPLAKAFEARQPKADVLPDGAIGTMEELSKRVGPIAKDLLGATFDNLPPVPTAQHGDGNSYRDPATGGIQIGASYWPDLQSLLKKQGDLTDKEARALSTFVHESIHGLGRWKRVDADIWERIIYATGLGRVLEEGSTELLAVLKTAEFAERLGLKVKDGEGDQRRWSGAGLLARHAYRAEVGIMESLLHFAAGTARPTPFESGNLDGIGQDLLVQVAGHWAPSKRLSNLAAEAVKYAPDDGHRAKRAQLFEQATLMAANKGQTQDAVHGWLWAVIHRDAAELPALEAALKAAQ